MTDADIDRAILASRECIGYNVTAPICNGERAIYRAGFAAGLEAAAKLAEDRKGAWYKIWNERGNVSISDATAAAIRALNTTKEK